MCTSSKTYMPYKNVTARIYLDDHISELFEIKMEVRQDDPISPKPR